MGWRSNPGSLGVCPEGGCTGALCWRDCWGSGESILTGCFAWSSFWRQDPSRDLRGQFTNLTEATTGVSGGVHNSSATDGQPSLSWHSEYQVAWRHDHQAFGQRPGWSQPHVRCPDEETPDGGGSYGPDSVAWELQGNSTQTGWSSQPCSQAQRWW